MLLTEHQEAYEKRNDKLVGRVNTEELRLIRDWIMFATHADDG